MRRPFLTLWILTLALATMWRAPISGFGYAYDKWGQRTNIARLFNNGRSSLALAYDPEGQMIAAVGRETNGTVRLQEKFGYAYGASDNLAWRTNDAQTQGFVSDFVNQLSNVTRAGKFTVSGSTPRPATNVTVNASNATLYADATWASWGHTVLDNQTNTYTVTAQSVLGSAQNILNVSLPPLVNYTSDANGNLTNDQARCFQYDAENQLTNAYVPNAWRTEFKYDGLNRRRIRKEYTWSGGAWVPTNEVRYVYDGLLILQERDSNNIPVLTYTRGLDLSSSLQGAGGIGGLLALSDQRASATSPTNYFYHSDGNGNIVALLNYQNEVVARYLYDPFGNLLAMSGPTAPFNRQRFSSKEWHSQSGLLLYEFRAYDPNLQRWLTQDPIGEAGGINLYRFVSNDPANRVDPLGESDFNRPPAIVIQNPGGNTEVRYGPPTPDPRITVGDIDGRTFVDLRDFTRDLLSAASEATYTILFPEELRELHQRLDPPAHPDMKTGYPPMFRPGLKPCPPRYPRDFQNKHTVQRSAQFGSEAEARALARQKVGSNPVDVGDNKLRSRDGRWQYRAKAGDVNDNHVHLERLDPGTGTVLENWHLEFPETKKR